MNKKNFKEFFNPICSIDSVQAELLMLKKLSLKEEKCANFINHLENTYIGNENNYHCSKYKFGVVMI